LKLAEMKEAQMRLASKLKAAMMYPMLMMLISGGLMLAIFTFIIPKIAKIFEGMNKPMPLLTKVMINISDFIVSFWYIMVALIGVALFSFNSWKNTEAGKQKWDAFKLKAPLFGHLIRMVAITRFANSMSTLLASGVPILSAMNISKNLVDNVPIADAISKARENITEGQSIAEPLRKSQEFPPMMIHMISIGEKTGELPEMLQNVANTYENQVNSKIEGLTSIIEPIMIVVMGLAIGFIVLSVFLPLLDMSNISKR
jgi:general secretion pathway protein F